jgi:hypothetical protein
MGLFFFYFWVLVLFLQGDFVFHIQDIHYFFAALNKEPIRNKKKFKQTIMTPTTRTLQPRVPTPPKKAKTMTRATPPKKATAKKTAPAKQSSKKPGRDHNNVKFFKHFADLCQFRSANSNIRVPRTHTGKNNSLANWINYTKKKKAAGKFPIVHVEALDESSLSGKLIINEKRHSRNGFKKLMSTRRPTTLCTLLENRGRAAIPLLHGHCMPH